MALVDSGVWSVTYTFRDNNGNTATMGVSYPGALTQAEVTTQATGLATNLGNVTDAALDKIAITRTLDEDAPATPPATSEVERKLFISMDAGRFRNAASISVPSPRFTLEQDGTDVPITASGAVLSLLNLLSDGGLGGNNSVTDNRGNSVTRAHSPIVRHRSRKLSRD